MPETSHVVDDGAGMALLGAQGAQVLGFVVLLLRRVFDKVLQPYQRSPDKYNT